jgi:hypothetical protein
VQKWIHAKSIKSLMKLPSSASAAPLHLDKFNITRALSYPQAQHKPLRSCRSGRGGNGEIAAEGMGKFVRNFKYSHNSGMKKEIWLPASPPADGQDGSDVVLVADPLVRSPGPRGLTLCVTCVVRHSCSRA